MTGAGVSEARRSAPADDAAPPGPQGRTCSMCGSTRRILDPIRLEESCADCGLVFEGAELVAAPPIPDAPGSGDGSGRGIGPFASASNPRRALGSTLSGYRDGQGRPLNWQKRYEFQHLKRVMQRQTARAVDGPLDRSMARSEIDVDGQRLDLPPVAIQEAERIFREAKLRGLFRGRNLPSSVGATLYAACRRYSIPRTLGEVAKASSARRSEVGRVFKILQRGLDGAMPSVGPRAFLARFAEELALSHTVRTNVEEMLEELNRRPEISGISPHGLVAAVIYLSAARNGERRSRTQVARVTAVTEVTLRSTSRLVERLTSDAPAP